MQTTVKEKSHESFRARFLCIEMRPLGVKSLRTKDKEEENAFTSTPAPVVYRRRVPPLDNLTPVP